MASFQRLGYPQWVQALKKLQQNEQHKLPLGTICFGPSSYLLLKTHEKLKRLAEQQGFQVESFQASDLDESGFIELIEQDHLFAQKKLIIINGFQSNPKLLTQCEFVFTKLSQSTKLVLLINQDRLAARIQKLLPAHFEQIPCFPPITRDLPILVKDLAKYHRLHIDHEACQLLADSLGQDLFKVENEVRNLSLIFPDSQQQQPTALEIGRALGSLREDHGFRLEEYILAKQAGKALNLLDDLVKRGESPLALLGILASHCRKALEIFATSGTQQTRIPAFIQKKFLHSLKAADRPRYLRALRLCHETDIMLKTSKVSDQLPLSEIIMTLTTNKSL